MVATSKFGGNTTSFEYNQNGEVTKLILPEGVHYELTYTNGKLTSLKIFKNGVLLTGTVNGPNGEYIGDFVLNSNNEMQKYKSDIYTYTNGNLTRYEIYDGPDKKLGEYRIEYDTKKHYLSASKSKGIFGSLYHFSRLRSDYGIILGAINTLVNNPVKLTTNDGVSLIYAYTYNASGFPTQVELSTNASTDKIKLKFSYSNCQ